MNGSGEDVGVFLGDLLLKVADFDPVDALDT